MISFLYENQFILNEHHKLIDYIKRNEVFLIEFRKIIIKRCLYSIGSTMKWSKILKFKEPSQFNLQKAFLINYCNDLKKLYRS